MGIAGQASREYLNLLEDGKEWNYKMICHDAKINDFEPSAGVDELRRTLRLEGTTEIDGVNYYNVKEYVALLSGEESDNLNMVFNLPQEAPILYLAEDCENGIVYVKSDDSGYIGGTWRGERMPPVSGVLYDFFNSIGINGNGGKLGDLSVESETGALRGYSVTLNRPDDREFVNYENLIVVEGVGFVDGTVGSYKYGCDLFGEAVNHTTSFPDRMYYPHLYNVTLADGSVIYSNPAYRWDMSSISTVQENAGVMLGNGKIMIKSTGVFRLYDSQGRLVEKSESEGSRCIDTTRLPHGLHLLVTGGKTFKILI